jgi:hypothetical protein
VKRRNRREKIPHVDRQEQSPWLVAFQQFLDRLPPGLRLTAARVQLRKPPCLLCDQPFHGVGVFVPAHPQRWGIAEGYQGGCVYALCETCVGLPDREDQWKRRSGRTEHRWLHRGTELRNTCPWTAERGLPRGPKEMT